MIDRPERDDRFDGKRIYTYLSAGPSVFDITDDNIGKTREKTVYVIRGNRIFEYLKASTPVFDIIGNKIHNTNSVNHALYEIR
jgi:hypothetical protein